MKSKLLRMAYRQQKKGRPRLARSLLWLSGRRGDDLNFICTLFQMYSFYPEKSWNELFRLWGDDKG